MVKASECLIGIATTPLADDERFDPDLFRN